MLLLPIRLDGLYWSKASLESPKGGVISRTECLGIAAVLGIHAEALTAALEYFDDLNIFLYYPSVLSER